MAISTERASEAQTALADEARAHEQRRTLIVASAGTLLALIVYTVPLTTMPSIARGLGAGAAAQTWILAAVSMGLAATLLTAGAIGDDVGRRRVLVAGAGLLAAASLACALAPTPLLFILAAVASGVGSSAVMTCSLGLIGHAFPPGPARNRAAGIWGASLGAGIGVGPLLAAGLEPAAGWRGAFALTAVLSLGLAVAGRLLLKESRSPDHKPVDVAGMLLLGAALAVLVAALVEGRTGWTRPAVLWMFWLGGSALICFAVLERVRRAPMLDLTLFRRPAFVAVTVAALANGLGVIALLSYLSTVVQRGLGDSVLLAAFLVSAWAISSVLASLAARHIPARIGGRVQLAAGLGLCAVGLITMYGLTEASSPLRILPGLLIAGAGSGVLNAALGREAVASVPAGRSAMGSGANITARYVGSSIGVSVVATIVAASGTGAHAVVAGWNTAALATAVISGMGALAVLACRPRASAPA